MVVWNDSTEQRAGLVPHHTGEKDLTAVQKKTEAYTLLTVKELGPIFRVAGRVGTNISFVTTHETEVGGTTSYYAREFVGVISAVGALTGTPSDSYPAYLEVQITGYQVSGRPVVLRCYADNASNRPSNCMIVSFKCLDLMGLEAQLPHFTADYRLPIHWTTKFRAVENRLQSVDATARAFNLHLPPYSKQWTSFEEQLVLNFTHIALLEDCASGRWHHEPHLQRQIYEISYHRLLVAVVWAQDKHPLKDSGPKPIKTQLDTALGTQMSHGFSGQLAALQTVLLLKTA